MKKNIFLYLLLFVILALKLLFFPYSAKAQPKIEFIETEYNLGEMHQNKKKSHIFKFRNSGTETLIIEKVKAG